MRVLDRLKRWLPRSFESVCQELAKGLENGTIVLDSQVVASDTPPAEPPPVVVPGDGVKQPPLAEQRQTT